MTFGHCSYLHFALEKKMCFRRVHFTGQKLAEKQNTIEKTFEKIANCVNCLADSWFVGDSLSVGIYLFSLSMVFVPVFIVHFHVYYLCHRKLYAPSIRQWFTCLIHSLGCFSLIRSFLAWPFVVCYCFGVSLFFYPHCFSHRSN